MAAPKNKNINVYTAPGSNTISIGGYATSIAGTYSTASSAGEKPRDLKINIEVIKNADAFASSLKYSFDVLQNLAHDISNLLLSSISLKYNSSEQKYQLSMSLYLRSDDVMIRCMETDFFNVPLLVKFSDNENNEIFVMEVQRVDIDYSVQRSSDKLLEIVVTGIKYGN